MPRPWLASMLSCTHRSLTLSPAGLKGSAVKHLDPENFRMDFIECWLAPGRALRCMGVFCQCTELLPPGLRRTQESLAPFAPGFAGEKGWGGGGNAS
jgi:hypothetical protein